MLCSFLCSLTFICSASCAASSAAERGKSPPGEWIIEQTSRDWGNQTIYVTSNAVKVENHKRNFVFMATANEANQYLFRPTEKIMATTSKFNWEEILPFVRAGNPHPPYTIQDNITWKGLRCRKLIESDVAWTLVAKDIDVDPKLAESVCMLYGMPHYTSLPVVNYQSKGNQSQDKKATWLKSGQFDSGGGSVLRFETASWKKIAYREADFQKPIGFRRVNPREIVFSRDERSAIESVINDVGFSSTPDSSKTEKKK